MNTRLLAMIVSTMSLSALAACNKAEAPADTANDVAEARKDAASEMGSAATDMRESAQDVEETRIEGDHKVALEKCESLAGEAQKACKDSADATYESAKSRLKTQMSNSDATGTAAAPGTTAAPATSSDTTSPGTATPKR